MSIDTVSVESVAAVGVTGRELRGETFRQLLRSKTFIAGAAIVLFWVLSAIFGAALVPHGAYAQDLTAINQPPSASHWFGTDTLGRDMFARVIVGSRDILIVAPLATLIGTVFGSALGLVMGYLGGVVDDSLGRLVEAFLALPVVVIGILGVAALGASNTTVVIVVGIVFTPLIARTVRAAVLEERQLDYVAAARLRGERAPYVMVVEILPNVLAPILVEFTVRLGYAVFTIVTLTFLGFGIQPPSPNWGLDIASNYVFVTQGDWWEVLFDALAIASLVVAVNMISNSVERALES